MPAPLRRRSDDVARVTVVTCTDSVESCDDLGPRLLDDVPDGDALVVELDAMTALSAGALGCLRELAIEGTRRGIQVILVSESIDVRANLVLAGIDALAPVLHTVAQAGSLVRAAA
jgi:hypothetical protein